MSNVRRSGCNPPARRRRCVQNTLVGCRCVRSRRWKHSGRLTKERFPNKRYPIVSLDPDLEMDITLVFVDSEAVPWLDRGIRVRTMGSWRRRRPW